MPALNHLHVYSRVAKKKDVYQCKHPDCMHYINKHLIIGKRAQCACGKTFILDSYQLQLKDPHCEGCVTARPPKNRRQGKKTATIINHDALLTALGEIGKQ